MLRNHRSKRASLTGNWDNLKAVRACLVCSAKFGVTRHKYHCRVCGHIVCSKCSKTRIHLPTSRSGQAKRVCDTCVPGVRAGLKSGEVLATAESDEGENEEEAKLEAAAALSSGLHLLTTAPPTAQEAAAAVAAVNREKGGVVLLSQEQEAEIVADSLMEAGF